MNAASQCERHRTRTVASLLTPSPNSIPASEMLKTQRDGEEREHTRDPMHLSWRNNVLHCASLRFSHFHLAHHRETIREFAPSPIPRDETLSSARSRAPHTHLNILLSIKAKKKNRRIIKSHILRYQAGHELKNVGKRDGMSGSF